MEKIYIAKIGKTVGLKGQMKIHIDTDFPQQFKKGAVLITHKKQSLTIETINTTSKTIKFEGIDTIEDAQKYTNSQLFTTQEDTVKNCKLEEKQFFWFDMIDCNIYEDDKLLGCITDVHRYPIDDYLEIQTDKSMLESNDELSKTFLLPYNDTYILEVDIDKKTILVKDAQDILEAS
ncbi:MAG TPA: 16S rRNA processing protein RimM [Arcobacter sp.]|nr:16S rRNA processing protein RimM [Arcobacter sp.]HIP55945.1 16S rRNA processing protein RimM [Arcobacter sp.]